VLAELPNLVRAHQLSANHRELMMKSRVCGCFHCLHSFSPKAIEEWVDEGRTALCPFCSDETLLPDAGLEINYAFLRVMREFWLE